MTSTTPAARRHGFTLIELLVVIAIIGTLTGLLLPAVQSAREAARRSSCVNNHKQTALAIQSFTAGNGQFPVGVGFTNEATDCPANSGRYLWTFKILPFIEMQVISDLISKNSWAGALDFSDPNTVKAFQTPMPTLSCPSDTHIPTKSNARFVRPNLTRSNIVGSFSPHGFVVEPEAKVLCLVNNDLNGGQSTTANPSVISSSPLVTKPGRSILNFYGVTRRPAHVTDGLSRTVLLSEHVASAMNYSSNLTAGDARGTWWGEQGVSFSHYLTPNSPQNDPYHGDNVGEKIPSGVSGLPDTVNIPGGWPALMMAARSRHPGGVNAALADGSVRFVADAVDSAVWTALGSMNGGEVTQTE